MDSTLPPDIDAAWRGYKTDPSRLDLRNELIEFYLPIVQSQAFKLAAKLTAGIEAEDLIADGVLGLTQAIEAFDLDRRVKFSTFCVLRVRGAMLDGLRELDWVPRLVRSQVSKLQRQCESLRVRYGRDPTVEELATAAGVTTDEAARWIYEANVIAVKSLDHHVHETDSLRSVREIDLLIDRRGEDPTRRLRDLDGMRRLTRGLSRAERLIIILYYYEQLTMKEIGRTIGMSESRVSQLHKDVTARLKESLAGGRAELAG